jgi:PAS domain S-box-containing protein
MAREHPTRSALAAFESLTGAAARRLQSVPRLPFIATALLVVLIAGLFAALLIEDRQMRRDALNRDIDSAAHHLSLRLNSLSTTLSTHAVDIGAGRLGEERFRAVARELTIARAELRHVGFVDPYSRVRWTAAPPFPAGGARAAGTAITETSTRAALSRARMTMSSTFSAPYFDPNKNGLVDLVVPVFEGERWLGAVVARIALDDLLRAALPPDAFERYRLRLIARDSVFASTSASEPEAGALTYRVHIDPLPPDVYLAAAPFHVQAPLTTRAALWIAVPAALAVLLTLAALARFVFRQQEVERALMAETALRQAMENSLATGLRVLDMHNVIRYVNPAFCRMTGWRVTDLVGKAPPFPYWPPAHRAEHEHKLDCVRRGAMPEGGFEVKVMRRDGTLFDARMDESPLVDNDGRQIGWLTSMLDITEQKRARRDLAAAHERFTTVLESLENAVSVAPSSGADGAALLFANRAYRALFGDDAQAHQRLATLLSQRESGEVRDEASGRWYDVRMRAIRWPGDLEDARLRDASASRSARLQIATDITLRKETEELVRRQQEKVQSTSRLMTLGEMASSLAHELNQPLTAIANYSEGSLTRLRAGQIVPADLLPALERTSSQAQRAGRIIRRIREFVKRSEPRRRPTPAARVIEDALGFAEIEARKKNIAILAEVAPELPPLDVDPILIEQVLLNLLKNAIDAMDDALIRRIDVKAHAAAVPGMAEIEVIDRGCGIAPEHREQLFEPFFSTKSEGMGMGLNICRSIVEFHQGRLTVDANLEPTGGTVMRVTLPLASASRPSPTAAETLAGASAK